MCKYTDFAVETAKRQGAGIFYFRIFARNMRNMGKRVTYIDQISGVLIVYMIVYHAMQWCGMWDAVNSAAMHVLSFFMFWFFYKSGMFCKERPLREILTAGFWKLIVPFLVFGFAGYALQCLQMFLDGDRTFAHYVLEPVKFLLLNGAPEGNLPLWFLPSLLAVQFVYAAVRKCGLGDSLVCVIGFAAAYLLFMCGVHSPAWACNVPLGLAVYAFGHIMGSRQYKISVASVALLVYVAASFVQQGTIDFRVNTLQNGNWFVAAAFALSGCVVAGNVFRKISLKLTLLEYVGRHSMSFYTMHWIVIVGCTMFSDARVSEGPAPGQFAVMLAACAVLLPLAEWLVRHSRAAWMLGVRK